MLLNSFYKITARSVSQKEITPGQIVSEHRLETVLDPLHPVFAGHFPGNPVVPGVFQIQMIIESMNEILNRKVRLKESDNIKFLSMIDPRVVDTLSILLIIKEKQEEQYPVNATISAGEQVYLKFKGIFSSQSIGNLHL